MKTRILILLCLVFVQPILSQNIRSRDIDSVTTLALKEFNVPGMAVAVVKDGKVIHAKGYGVRSIRNNQQSGPDKRIFTGRTEKL
jgi:CubicO group peptidase (beta-lactamase class C family)